MAFHNPEVFPQDQDLYPASKMHRPYAITLISRQSERDNHGIRDDIRCGPAKQFACSQPCLTPVVMPPDSEDCVLGPEHQSRVRRNVDSAFVIQPLHFTSEQPVIQDYTSSLRLVRTNAPIKTRAATAKPTVAFNESFIA